MKKILVIATNTAKEIFRDRILYGLMILAILLVLASLALGELSFAEQAKIITDIGLVTAELGCCMLAIFVGSSLVFREIDRQTVLTLLSKPVSRSQFIMGKFLGLTLVLLVVDILISGFLGGVCAFYGKINLWPFFISEVGVLGESLILLSMTIFFGVFCRPILTTMFTFSMWLLGHATGDLNYFSLKSQNPLFKTVGSFIARILPDLNAFTFKEAVIYGDIIPRSALVHGLLLWVAWTFVLLTAASLIFQRRDFT